MTIAQFVIVMSSPIFAWWCKRSIPQFAEYINRQIYSEYSTLLPIAYSYQDFRNASNLQPKYKWWGNLFYIVFPLLAFGIADPVVALLLMILCFLSALDYCYYLTDIRYVAAVFVLALLRSVEIAYQESLLFCCLFFGMLGLCSHLIFKKEILGSGDSLLFIALSPLFSLEDVFLLLLIASFSGIAFYLFYFLVMKKTLKKLPFIPFISFSTFVLIIDKIYI
ncbi:leader peptidase HopD [Actinobacillus lignieresii]|uniref:Leader peptidase HopD n=2 Tax=Actinobacillus lignieresii TaxID=720 RepID=A0A380TTV3_ACTLI|nr:prepilin peptidase [Actinobacillus lignieresii]SUT90957.1 leader peptidase HopD [Actinobacillus lignieresii]SUT96225.1 leader peptidase HopD [Actinobacillus lignieresii]VEB25707.1 leader peptidase HopD [Actinobacillus lignieresii]